MNWNKISSLDNLKEIIDHSSTLPVLIFKHSTRCSISRSSLDRIERNWASEDDKKALPYFLDLLNHHDVSNAIESMFGIEHESPQVLLIKNGSCFYSATHSAINYADIMSEVG